MYSDSEARFGAVSTSALAALKSLAPDLPEVVL